MINMTEMRIIHPGHDGTVCVVIPAANCGISLEEIARKDVPAGVPYKIVDASVIPSDRSFRDAWEADFSEPDGYGIGAEAWFAEQEGAQ
jgi:hypothetical protein